jgi:membrane associated rhomboid family serine protease
MMLFPISTDRHDGSIGIASLSIIGICLLANFVMMFEKQQVDKRVQDAVEAYTQEQNKALYENAPPMKALEDYAALKMRMADSSNSILQMRRGRDSVENSVRRESMFYRLAFTPAHFNIVSLFTSMFLHGGWMHLIGNMIFFYVCGVAMEKYWGSGRFVLVYLGCGVAASLSFMGFCAIDWQRLGNTPCVGASGAIAGAMGAFLATHSRAKVKLFWALGFRMHGTFNVVAWVYLGFWFLSQIFFMLLDVKQTLGVAYTAHIGGFLAGIVLGRIIKSEEETSLVQPAFAGKGTGRRAVLPDHLAAGAPVKEEGLSQEDMYLMSGTALRHAALGLKNRKPTITEQAAALQEQAIKREARPIVSQCETEGFLAIQRGDQAAAARNLVTALDNYLQTPQEHRDKIASVLTKILEAKPPLPILPAQLYQWAKGIYMLDLKELSLACLDRASLDASNPHIQKNSMLNAAGIRIQHRYQLESAAAGLQKLLSIEPAGVIANQAKQYLGQLQQMYNSPT